MIQKKRDGLRWDGMKRKGSKIEISEDGTTAIRQEGGGDFLGQHFAVATSWGIDVGEKFSWIIQFVCHFLFFVFFFFFGFFCY